MKNILSMFLLATLLAGIVSPLLIIKSVDAQIPPGIQRGDTFIYGLDARTLSPTTMNLWVPGYSGFQYGLMLDELYNANWTAGVIMPLLAAELPTYNSDFTNCTIKLRKGIYWSDGVEFTADDVVYTIKLHMNVGGFTRSAFMNSTVKTVWKADNYTVFIEFYARRPKFHMQICTFGGIAGLCIMPRHVWEKSTDPLSFKFFPPIGTGAYVIRDYDTQGYWCLWERRNDWERSSIGAMLGKPKPKYVLGIYYAEPETKMLAMAKHELDFAGLVYELIGELRKVNPYARGWWSNFPFIWLDGICNHGPVFNCEKYPYNITDVRWALTLAINMTEVNIIALNAMGRIASMHSLSVSFLEKQFKGKMLPWLENFALPGDPQYKPWDPTIPDKIGKYVEKELGYALPADPHDIYGMGWWKYDTKEAAKLLEKNGFYKDAVGKWHLPGGNVWAMDYVALPLTWYGRVSSAVCENWRKFGIDITYEPVEGAVHNTRLATGDFDVWGVNGRICSAIPDSWQMWDGILNKKYYTPTGKVATGCQSRWVNDKVSLLLDQLATMPPTDPQVLDIECEIMKTVLTEMPEIGMFLGSQPETYDTYVWTNYPTGENRYAEPCHWAPHYFKLWLPFIKSTGIARSEYTAVPTLKFVGVWFTKATDAFTGADQKRYGPFVSGQYAIIPEVDSKRLIEEGKASNIMPVATEVATVVSKVLMDVDRVSAKVGNVTTSVEALTAKVDSLGSQSSTLTMVAAAEGVGIVVLAIALVVIVRRKPS